MGLPPKGWSFQLSVVKALKSTQIVSVESLRCRITAWGLLTIFDIGCPRSFSRYPLTPWHWPLPTPLTIQGQKLLTSSQWSTISEQRPRLPSSSHILYDHLLPCDWIPYLLRSHDDEEHEVVENLRRWYKCTFRLLTNCFSPKNGLTPSSNRIKILCYIKVSHT